jgi:hypothetical protein
MIGVATAVVAMDGVDPAVLRFVVVLAVGFTLGILSAYAHFRRRLDLANREVAELTHKLFGTPCVPVEVPE